MATKKSNRRNWNWEGKNLSTRFPWTLVPSFVQLPLRTDSENDMKIKGRQADDVCVATRAHSMLTVHKYITTWRQLLSYDLINSLKFLPRHEMPSITVWRSYLKTYCKQIPSFRKSVSKHATAHNSCVNGARCVRRETFLITFLSGAQGCKTMWIS